MKIDPRMVKPCRRMHCEGDLVFRVFLFLFAVCSSCLLPIVTFSLPLFHPLGLELYLPVLSFRLLLLSPLSLSLSPVLLFLFIPVFPLGSPRGLDKSIEDSLSLIDCLVSFLIRRIQVSCLYSVQQCRL